MAQHHTADTLIHVSKRARLAQAKKPYWILVERGLHLGIRILEKGHRATWNVRSPKEGGDYFVRLVGPAAMTAEDDEAANGVTLFSYGQALKKAREIVAGSTDAPIPLSSKAPLTVQQARDHYVAVLQSRNGHRNNVSRIHLDTPVDWLPRPVTSVSKAEFRKLRASLQTRKALKRDSKPFEDKRTLSLDTINRIMANIRAMFNAAIDIDERLAAHRKAWEEGLEEFEGAGVDVARDIAITDLSVIHAVVAQCYQGNEGFGLLAEIAAVTGARPISQVAKLRVKDIDAAGGRIWMPPSGKGSRKKKRDPQPLPVSPQLIARAVKYANRLGLNKSDILLRRPDGQPWGENNHNDPFARAAERAGAKDEDGNPITMYALRHSSIVRMLTRGRTGGKAVSPHVVATAHDTSEAEIKRHYGRYIIDHAEELLRDAMLDLSGPPPAGNVVTLKKRA